MLANTMMVGQVGLAVAPLYLQKNQLELVGDTNHKGDAPFLKPFKESIRDMLNDLIDGTSGGVNEDDQTAYRVHVAALKKRYQIDSVGTIDALLRKKKKRSFSERG